MHIRKISNELVKLVITFSFFVSSFLAACLYLFLVANLMCFYNHYTSIYDQIDLYHYSYQFFYILNSERDYHAQSFCSHLLDGELLEL